MEDYTLDQTDLKLLALLQANGELTYKQLGKATFKTHNPIVLRVERLKRLGYIKRTVAVLDIHKIRSVFIAFPMIQLKSHTEESFLQFQTHIAGLPEVLECNHVMGQYDFILKIMVSDAAAYNEFLRKNISILDYIQRVESFPVLTQVKENQGYPI